MSDKFGTARDADVFLAMVVAAAVPKVDRGGQDLIDVMVERRGSARVEFKRLASPRWRGVCIDLVEASERGVRRSRRRRKFRRIAARQCSTRLKILVEGRGLKRLSIDAKHDVRNQAKTLRYTIDFLAESPANVTRRTRRLDLLGDSRILRQTLKRSTMPMRCASILG